VRTPRRVGLAWKAVFTGTAALLAQVLAARALLARVLLALGGLATIGYGLHGLLTMQRATHPTQAARWLLGGLLIHDVVVFPVTAAIGFVLTRLVRAPYRAVVQGALLVSVAVALSSLPLWRGYGGAADNPSVDPLPYGRNLAIVLGLVWAGAAVVIVGRAVRLRRERLAVHAVPGTEGETTGA
jgi:hypothetical protein